MQKSLKCIYLHILSLQLFVATVLPQKVVICSFSVICKIFEFHKTAISNHITSSIYGTFLSSTLAVFMRSKQQNTAKPRHPQIQFASVVRQPYFLESESGAALPLL